MPKFLKSQEIYNLAVNRVKNGEPISQVSLDMGLIKKNLSYHCHKQGVKSKEKFRTANDQFSFEIQNEIKLLVEQGCNHKQISLQLNLNRRSVAHFCRKNNLKINYVQPKKITAPRPPKKTDKEWDEYFGTYAKNRGGSKNEPYRGSFIKISWTCKFSHFFLKRPNEIQQGQWCPECARLAQKNKNKPTLSKLTWREFFQILDDVKLIFLKKKQVNLDEKCYKTGIPYWDVQCFCGTIWKPVLKDIRLGKINSCGCIKSLPQKEISEYIKSLGFCVDENNRQLLNGVELDIFIPEKKLAIEYNGLNIHSENPPWKPKKYSICNDALKRHKYKFDLCKEAGIELIQIFDEWLYKKEAVQGYICAKLGLNKKIHARKTLLKKIDVPIAKDFLKKYHIQGSTQGESWGLYIDNELLSIAMFSKHRDFSLGHGYCLTRFCNKPGFTVVGGLSKILAHLPFETSYLITYSDNRWTQGNLYQKTGFKKLREVVPSYWYFKNKGPIIHKSNFRKEKIFAKHPHVDRAKTEWQIMQELGYNRIWDAGKVTWIKCNKDEILLMK